MLDFLEVCKLIYIFLHVQFAIYSNLNRNDAQQFILSSALKRPLSLVNFIDHTPIFIVRYNYILPSMNERLYLASIEWCG